MKPTYLTYPLLSKLTAVSGAFCTRNFDPMYKGMIQQDPQQELQFMLHQAKVVCHLVQDADAIVAAENELELLPSDAQEVVHVVH